MKQTIPAMRSVILVTLLLTLFGQILPKTASADTDFSQVCAKAVHAAEIVNQLPRRLLHAVSLTESGRWNDKAEAAIAWPWTITAGAKGKFFRTRDEALAEVRRLQSQGISNIDVGCMQINLQYHGHVFQNIEEAIDPINNVAYAATFLKDLRLKSGSWAHAVGRYHTSNWKGRGKDYWRRVRTFWTTEQLRDFRARRAARIEKNRRPQIAARH
ncbi:MAG: transglycosylase SLT domain-containing protein [Proteobacteria bacterium]|nr:transglycosylase SLT domain-containing protein [Pseudomonadota bacterium]